MKKQKEISRDFHNRPDLPDQLLSAIVEQYRFSTLGSLIKGIIHNLNGGLQILSMRMELLQRVLRQDPDKNPPGIEEQVAQCLSQIDQFRGMIEVLTRQGVQEDQDLPQPIPINQLLEEVLALFYHNLFFKHQVKVQKIFSAALPPLQGNPAGMTQAFWNLIQNAAEAMENTTRKELTLITEEKEGKIRVTIKDTGCGVPKEIQSRLFEPLVTSKGIKHRGLGLFAARELLKPFGASFSYSSQEGETSFAVYLPVATVLGRGN